MDLSAGQYIVSNYNVQIVLHWLSVAYIETLMKKNL